MGCGGFLGRLPCGGSRRTRSSGIRWNGKRRASPAETINLEVGLLRRILKYHKQWARLADDVKMLPERPKAGRVMTLEEKARLLETAASKPDWQIAHCAAVLALNTTMRGCELRGLRWQDVDLFERTLTIRRQSTTSVRPS